MSGNGVLLEEKMKDRRFRRTEYRLLAVFFDGRFDTMRELAKEAGIGRSTLYIHHRKIKEMLPDWEKYILAEYCLDVTKRAKLKNTKMVYLDTLTFILKHQKFFEMFLKFENRGIIIKMLCSLYPSGYSRKVFRIYVSEITEVIFEWGERGFLKEEMDNVLADIIYLTETARDRLMPINK